MAFCMASAQSSSFFRMDFAIWYRLFSAFNTSAVNSSLFIISAFHTGFDVKASGFFNKFVLHQLDETGRRKVTGNMIFFSSLQFQSHVDAGIHGIIIISGNLIKTVFPVQADCILQKRKCVQKHAAIPDLFCICQNLLHQPAADLAAPVCRPHIQAFHLTALCIDLPKPNAACQPVLLISQIKPAFRQAVFRFQVF